MRYKVYVPPTYEMGDYRTVVNSSDAETVEQNALWDYNSAREHDGLPPLKRMPRDTIYTEVKDE